MRPNKEQSDLEFWSKAVQYWTERAEFWFLASAKDSDPSVEINEKNARQRKFQAELAFQEAQGLIEVYTGRAKPSWTKKTAPMALGNRLTPFTLA